MWKKIITASKRAAKAVIDSKVQRAASSMAYITVLSIIPLLALSLSISKAIGILPQLIEKMEPLVLNYLAVGTDDQFVANLQMAIDRINEGALGSLGFITLLVTSTILLHEINNAIQVSWRIEKRRSFLKSIVFYWLIIALGPLSLAILLGVMSPEFIGILDIVPTTWIAFSLIFFIIFLIFKIVPNTQVRPVPALLSALITAIFLFAGHFIFAWATSSVLYYNKVYGSLAAIPLFLLWLWIIWLIFLSGSVLCYSLQGTRQH
jgi:membrane protein